MQTISHLPMFTHRYANNQSSTNPFPLCWEGIGR